MQKRTTAELRYHKRCPQSKLRDVAKLCCNAHLPPRYHPSLPNPAQNTSRNTLLPLLPATLYVALKWEFLTTWSPDNIFQKSVLRRHQSSLSPVHSAGGRRRSGSQALRRMVAEVKKSGWVSVGGMEKLMVTLRLAWLVGGLCLYHWALPELRAAGSPVRMRLRTCTGAVELREALA